MTHSEQINEIAAALAKAQGKIEGAVKAAENPGFKRGNAASKYADLSAVWDACREQLSANGIAVIQAPRTEGSVVTVETLLTHASGQWIRDSLSASAADARPQAIGSTITYLRRYALASMVGVAPEDDDAEKGEGRETKAGRPEKPAPTNAGAKPSEAAASVRAALKDPAFRKQECLRELMTMGLNVRGEVGHAIGRTIPEPQEIKLTSAAELEKLENHVAMLKAKHNQGRAEAAH